MEQNKKGKYFKYAIGEIILVMIGILLALQVNEWNNERNRKKSEQVIIEQLITDLSQSQYELERLVSNNLRSASVYSHVLRAFWKTKLPDDILKYVRRGGGSNVYSPILGTAQSLINSGKLDIISSKELKNDVVAYVEAVEYTLKDINRYEESYFRPGVALLQESIPSTIDSIDSIESINERTKSLWRWKWEYDRNLNSIPEVVEKIPFKTDLKQLFEDQNFFLANDKLHLYHRNISFRYSGILSNTNELLAKLYLASDKYQELGVRLTESAYYLIFDAQDLEILKLTDQLLGDSSKWDKSLDNDCNNQSAEGKFNLNCALIKASKEVVGEWNEDPFSPAIRLILLKLSEDKNRRYVQNMLMQWNHHPDTTFKEVKTLLRECIELIENQINTND